MNDVTLSTLALDHLAEGVLLVDAAGSITYANHRAAALFGRTPEALVGTSFSAPIQTTEPVELTVPQAGGAPAIAEMQVVPLQVGDGRALSLVSLRDVTARRKAEMRLREREELYRSVIENAHDGFWITDQEARLLEVNDAYLRMTGFRREDLIGRRPDFVDVGADADAAAVQARLAHIKAVGSVLFETRHRTRGGGVIDVEISTSYTPIADGRIFAFIRDITPRKQAEASVLAAKTAAEKANQAKSEFLAAMSHDLRTPLNAIMGFADMMRMETFGPLGHERYGEYLESIHDSGALLVSLVNDLLDLSKVEAGKYDLQEESLDVAAIMDMARQQTATMAAEQGQRVELACAERLPRLRGDERALIQVFDNLLSNAIKFNRPEGLIRFTADLEADRALVVRIADEGIGMSEDAVRKALRPFEQIDSVHARRHKGTGLGLYLCVQFMRLLGGDLDIASQPGQGTTVTLRFPPERVTASVAARPQPEGRLM